MSRPFHVTTNAAVIAAAGSNAASIAWLTFAMSRPAGGASAGRTSPAGHGWVEGSGNPRLTDTGLNSGESLPAGSVTQPWSPRYRAVRLTPFGSVTCTAF